MNEAIYLALSVRPDGTREILGLWIENTEGPKFWMKVFSDLRTRGVQDILIAVTDGLKGMSEALGMAFPATTRQTCIVHLIRNSLDYASWKDRQELALIHPLNWPTCLRRRTQSSICLDAVYLISAGLTTLRTLLSTKATRQENPRPPTVQEISSRNTFARNISATCARRHGPAMTIPDLISIGPRIVWIASLILPRRPSRKLPSRSQRPKK